MGRIVIMGGDGIMGNGEEDNLWRGVGILKINHYIWFGD